MDIIDVFLYVLFGFGFYLYLNLYKDKYLKNAFTVKYIITFIVNVAAFHNDSADSSDTLSLYFSQGNLLYNAIIDDFSNIKIFFLDFENINSNIFSPEKFGYLENQGNFIVVKIVAIFGIFCFCKYVSIGLFFSMFSFWGLWKLFSLFCSYFPANKKFLFILFFYYPSLIYWSSGVLKDSICLGALGLFAYSMNELFILKKNKYKNLIIIGLSAYLLLIKPYILLSFIPCFSLFLISTKIRQTNYILDWNKKILIFILCFFIFYSLSILSNNILSKYALNSLFERASEHQGYLIGVQVEGGSNFSIGGNFDGTMGSFISLLPNALFSVFFRPFIWESNTFLQILTSIESTIILFYCIYSIKKAGITFFFKQLYYNPLLLSSFTFAIIFGAFVGITTLNFGTLVRYKIPCMPFLLACFIVIPNNSKFFKH